MRAESNSAARTDPSDEESLDDEGSDGEEQQEEDAGSAPDAAQEPDMVGLPCAVKAVFVGHCQSCHGVDAKNGTPLLMRDDLLAFSRKEPSMTVVQRVLTRVTASEKPMPPVGKGVPLSDEELSVLRDWVDGGAQPGRCDE